VKHFVITSAMLFALAACNQKTDFADPKGEPQASAPKAGGPPPIPPYQMRAERMASGGEALFSNRCGACHLAGGMGTNLLTKQMMMAKRPPSDGLLANRTDLTADYVKTVVRTGKNAMPAQTRVDITDADLEIVAKYLGKAGA
jgi:mono/diheme cytochrome c family protein